MRLLHRDIDAARPHFGVENGSLIPICVMIGYKTPDGEGYNWIESHNGDPEAATRLAITRAAAEIGKSMP